MKDDKMIMPSPKSAFMIIGVLAIVYGIINYLITEMNWDLYTSWIAGGVVLLLVSWAKGSTRE